MAFYRKVTVWIRDVNGNKAQDAQCFGARFHRWGDAVRMMTEKSWMKYTVAIVELPTGQVVEVDPSDVKFEDTEKSF